jgi:hypothetical protein
LIREQCTCFQLRPSLALLPCRCKIAHQTCAGPTLSRRKRKSSSQQSPTVMHKRSGHFLPRADGIPHLAPCLVASLLPPSAPYCLQPSPQVTSLRRFIFVATSLLGSGSASFHLPQDLPDSDNCHSVGISNPIEMIPKERVWSRSRQTRHHDNQLELAIGIFVAQIASGEKEQQQPRQAQCWVVLQW